MTDALEFVDKPTGFSERRLHPRQQVRSIAYVELDEGNGGIVLNVSEGGLSVQAVVSLMDDQLPRMRIQLPQLKDWLETGARIVWTGQSRKVVGLQFVNLSKQARSQIRQWVSQEALPAPLPPESNVRSGEQEQLSVAPVALGHAGDGYGHNVPLTAEAAVALPVTQAEELAPAPSAGAAPRPDSPPAGQAIGRVFDQPRYAELKLIGRPFKADALAPKPVSSRGALVTLIAALALMSLATGWAAGRGAFGGVLANVRAMISSRSATELGGKSSAAGPITPVSEAETVGAVHQPSVIPANALAPVTEPSPRRKAPASPAPQPHEKWVILQARNLSPTIRRQGAEYANALGRGALPPTIEMRGGLENILPSGGALDLRRLIPPPPVEQQPAVLRRAELVHRVDPVYPEIARERQLQGIVKLRVTIGQDGAVRSVELVSGSPLLARAAMDAVRQWRYTPTLMDGKPIQSDNEISIEFGLSDSSK
jgi:TonB family protein